jgi:hypothetical protein
MRAHPERCRAAAATLRLLSSARAPAMAQLPDNVPFSPAIDAKRVVR